MQLYIIYIVIISNDYNIISLFAAQFSY